MAAEPPTETTDRSMMEKASYEEPLPAQEHEMLVTKSPVHLHTHAHGVAVGGIAGRVRERRLSSSSHPAASEVGAPCVWTTPDWAAHPVIENYYGHARRARVNSFYEVMQSPTNTLATRTLAENCNSYGSQEEEEEEEEDAEEEEEGGKQRTRVKRNAVLTQPTRKLGSFSYSYTTETSDEVVSASPSFSTSTADSGYEARRVHVGDAKMPAAVGGVRPTRNDSTGSNHKGYGKKGTGGGGGGYAHWNRRRLQSDATTEMVPTPHPNGRMKKPAQDAVQNMTRQHHHQEELLYENPQGGHILNPERSPSAASSSSGDSPMTIESPLLRPRASLTSGRLKSKLQECLLQIDDRIDVEAAMARDAYACIARSTKDSAVSKRESLMWSLLCGARTSTSRSKGSASFDGIEFLQERLSVALHHRALNQLHRHRRHVNGILQIVTSHNPDLNLTEKQLDSFESADATLANDIKYAMLQRQVEALATTSKKRLDALRHAKIKNGRDCFESARVKSAMLAKLLEAVSWYRLVQTNSREESASTSVGLSVEASATEATGPGPVEGESVAQQQEQHESSLSSGSSGSSSSISASRSLQELQVERILSVLAGEEFYSDYNELMCQPDWWEIAQAHFENIIFSKAESRVCQWVNRVSKEVAAVCHEALEEENSYRVGDKHAKADSRSQHASMAAAAALPHAEWTKDPQPEQILEFIDRLTRRIRKELDVPSEVTKSLNAFVQRMVFPRLALLCFNQKTMIDCQRKDKLWRKRCVDLSGIPLENLGVVSDLAGKIRSKLPSRRVSGGRKSFLIRAIDAFNCMTSVVPCDLLDELMYGVVILHHEAALVLGTTQFSVETFFPLLTYVLLHCQLPTIHAQLHLLENYAINNSNLNGEESYYVYCVHAAVEYVCNSAGLTTTPPVAARTKEEPVDIGQEATVFPVDPLSEQKREAAAVPVPVASV